MPGKANVSKVLVGGGGPGANTCGIQGVMAERHGHSNGFLSTNTVAKDNDAGIFMYLSGRKVYYVCETRDASGALTGAL